MAEHDATMTSRENNDEEVRYFVPNIGKGRTLRAMARRCFADSFAHLFDREPFEKFLEEVYDEGGLMSRELLDTNIEWLIAEVCEKIIGYAKLCPLVASAPNPKKGAMELQQIYVLREWHGRGVGDRLMRWALDRASTWCARDISYGF
jgi:GNAT superfamily N-acetyltransferase